MNLLSILSFGFLLGLRHATDADHVVAIATIVSRQKKIKSATVIGAVWGIGHTLTVFLVGVAIIFFQVVIPETLALSFEFIVALVLIFLGLANLTGAWNRLLTFVSGKKRIHAHLHLHDTPHVHVHTHEEHVGETQGRRQNLFSFIRTYGTLQIVRAFIVGVIHGVAGSAAIAILILTTIKNSALAVFYLLIFGFGTVIGMMLMTTAIGLPIVASKKKIQSFDRIATIVSGLISLLFGTYLAYRIGVVDGLFPNAANWG